MRARIHGLALHQTRFRLPGVPHFLGREKSVKKAHRGDKEPEPLVSAVLRESALVVGPARRDQGVQQAQK